MACGMTLIYGPYQAYQGLQRGNVYARSSSGVLLRWRLRTIWVGHDELRLDAARGSRLAREFVGGCLTEAVQAEKVERRSRGAS